MKGTYLGKILRLILRKTELSVTSIIQAFKTKLLENCYLNVLMEVIPALLKGFYLTLITLAQIWHNLRSPIRDLGGGS